MSLQGSLDTFALPDVLILLASTKKTGELHVSGNRGPGGTRTGDLQGLLWVADGLLVGHDVAKASDAATAVFELLRLQEGTFSFVAGAPANPQEPEEIEPVLGEAQTYLAEWQQIERVVPSLSAWMQLSPEAPAAHVSMRAEQWRIIVAIGGGCDVAHLVEHLGQGELGGCRSIKELAEAGLVDITVDNPRGSSWGNGSGTSSIEATEAIAATEASEPTGAPASAELTPTYDLDAPGSDPEAPERKDFFASRSSRSKRTLSDFDSSDPFGIKLDDENQMSGPSALHAAADAAVVAQSTPAGDQPAEEPSLSTVTDFDSLVSLPSRAKKSRASANRTADSPTFESRRTLSAVTADESAEGQLPEAQALSRQLAALSDGPAVAAPTPSAGPAGFVDGEGEDGDEPLNRGLLLKFLSSVRN